MKITKNKSSHCNYSFTIKDSDQEITLHSHKCMCGSCEAFYVKVFDKIDKTDKKYEFWNDSESDAQDVLVEIVEILANELWSRKNELDD